MQGSTRIFIEYAVSRSPRAYEYLRDKFNNNSPHPGTIRSWFALENTNGGTFHDAAFQTLRKLADQFGAKNKKVYVLFEHAKLNMSYDYGQGTLIWKIYLFYMTRA